VLEAPVKKAQPKIVSFASPVEAEHSSPDPAKLVSGRPVHTTRNHYADPAQQFFSGVWASTEGKWRIQYAEHEFCSLLEGHVRLEGDDGSVAEFHAGDNFVIPAGFSGTWETVAACRKLYVIYLPAAPQAKVRAAVRRKKPRRKSAHARSRCRPWRRAT
jgi:uncharacterized cupin superfamily protein